jgi:CubicO group peptidase (beta-lactamase class C family)
MATFIVRAVACVALWSLTASLAFPSEGISQAQALEALDKVWATRGAQKGLPGAVISLVSTHGLFVVKGYGVRDVQSAAPVVPSETLFRVGSVTKLFTAILALQAIEQERLGFDSDVRGMYRDLKISDDYPEAVTVRQLLSHSGGFDSNLSGILTPLRADAQHFAAARMARHLRRVRTPGVLSAYDNSGAALLGEVAARSFGQDYATAVKQRILEPLGMHRSMIGLSAAAETHAAACHRVEGDGHIARCRHTFMRKGFEGAGALSTTAQDMGGFLQMLLNAGRSVDGTDILSSRSFEQFVDVDTNRFHPGIDGMGLIMQETHVGKRRALHHGGGYDGFTSSVYVFPDEGYALFVSVTEYPGLPVEQNLGFLLDLVQRAPALAKYDAEGLIGAMAEAIGAILPPVEGTTSQASVAMPADLPPQHAEGFYAEARHESVSLLDRLVIMALRSVRVQKSGDKSVVINGEEFEWLHGGLYRSRKTGRVSAFKATALGTALAANSFGPYIRVPWYRTPAAALAFPAAMLLLLASSVLALVMARQAQPRRLAAIQLGVSLVAIAFLLLELQTFPGIYYSGAALWLVLTWRSLYVLAMLAGALSIVLLVRSARVASVRQWRFADKLALLLPVAPYLLLLGCAAAWDTLHLFD